MTSPAMTGACGSDVDALTKGISQLSTTLSTPEKCVISTKEFGDKLIKALEPYLIECKDQLKNEINTKVLTEYFKKERDVNIRRIPNPLAYAMHFHEEYMGKVPEDTKILFVGMNPSPSSLTGIPFYEEDAMTNLFGAPLLTDLLNKMPDEYQGNATSESGRRLWRFVSEKFVSYDKFFRHCFIMNYSPLIFMDKDDKNVALDGFNGASQPLLNELMKISDFGFEDIINIIKPTLVIGIGWYAYNRIKATGHTSYFQINHPSPAANDTYEEWIKKVDKKLDRNDSWKDVMAKIEKEEKEAVDAILSTPEKCVKSTKEFGDKLIKELEPHLIEGKDQLKTEINTTVLTEHYENERDVNIRRIPNPLAYAMHFHEEYMMKVPEGTKIMFVGMNPSPSSLTGIPFYEEDAMTNLFGAPLLTDLLNKMPDEYQGNATSESGRRFWRFVLEKFDSYDKFFRHCFIMNYSPLIFMDKDDRNVALDGFNGASQPLLNQLMKISDFGFEDIIKIMNPTLLIGIGWYAYNRLKAVPATSYFQMDHPSPAANDTYEEWIEKVDKKLDRNDSWKNVMAQIEEEEKDAVAATLSTPEKCVKSTKEFGDKLIKELEPHLIEGKDQLTTEINTTVLTEHYENERDVNIRRIPNPLAYAMHFHEEYMMKVPEGTKIMFVGMNPSPSSLTGIPFYEEDAMTNLFGAPLLTDLLNKMPDEYQGNATSESGRRFWRFVLEKFDSYDKFFRHCFIMNYSPLIFMDKDDRNVALDGFNGASQPLLNQLMKISDFGFEDIIKIMNPTLLIGIGWYAYNRLKAVPATSYFQMDHPSPAANDTYEEWITKVDKKLERNDSWKDVMAQIEEEEKDVVGATLSTPEKCVESTKEFGDKLIKALEPHLIEVDKDQLKTDINTIVVTEHYEEDRPVNIRRIPNPLAYAMHFHEEYMMKVPEGTKILFVGMNPSPSSLTGIPFYEEEAMTNLFGATLLNDLLNTMPEEYQGNSTSESGRRFWRFVLEKFDTYDKFFRHCFIMNYSPLIFMDKDDRNVALDGFNGASQPLLNELMQISDFGFEDIIKIMKPTLLIGIGWYAYNRIEATDETSYFQIDHPSPAANDTYEQWIEKVDKKLDNDTWRSVMAEIEEEEQNISGATENEK